MFQDIGSARSISAMMVKVVRTADRDLICHGADGGMKPTATEPNSLRISKHCLRASRFSERFFFGHKLSTILVAKTTKDGPTATLPKLTKLVATLKVSKPSISLFRFKLKQTNEVKGTNSQKKQEAGLFL
jgi:hypothetical protein